MKKDKKLHRNPVHIIVSIERVGTKVLIRKIGFMYILLVVRVGKKMGNMVFPKAVGNTSKCRGKVVNNGKDWEVKF